MTDNVIHFNEDTKIKNQKISAVDKISEEEIKKEQELFFQQILEKGLFNNIICITTDEEGTLGFYQLNPDLHEAIFHFEFLKTRMLSNE